MGGAAALGPARALPDQPRSELARSDLSGEAIRLTRIVRRALPDDPEVAGLLALMLLTEARRRARADPNGELIPPAEQDRSLWDRDLIAEGLHDFRSTVRALVGSLPVVLLLLFFVGLSAEIWQVATRPRAGSFAILIVAIVAIALVVAFWGCLRELAAYEDSLERWTAVRAAVDDSDDDELKSLLKAHVKTEGATPSPDLGFRPRVNVLTVMMLYQVMYCTAVGLAMTGVFYGVGLLAVDDEMLDRWDVEIPDERRAGWAVGANQYSLWPLEDRPWTRLAVLLGAFSALAFVAHVTAGDEERRRFFEGPDKGIKARLAARIVYRDKYQRVSRARARSRFRPGAADREEARPAAPAGG